MILFGINSFFKKMSNIRVTDRNQPISESYDEYLEFIYRLTIKGDKKGIKNSDIAKALNVKAPSVTAMLKKLENTGYIKKKEGTRLWVLDAPGEERAKTIINSHIMIELLLKKVLKLKNPTEIDAIACKFEHFTTDDFLENLSKFLGIKAEQINDVPESIKNNVIPESIPVRCMFFEDNIIKLLKDLGKEFSIEDKIEDYINDKKYSKYQR